MKKGFGFKKKTEQSVNSGRHSSDVKSNPVRMGVIVMITGFLGLVLWVALAPLDEGVPCDGVVSIATKSKVIQHLYGGIVKNVYVREGLLVHEGDSLMSLDKSSVNAAYEEVSQHYLGLRASESRLIAEQKGLVSIVFHNDLVSASDKALVGSLIENQKRLFSSRQDLRRILQKQLDGIRDLVKEGYAPLEQQWELERRLAEMDASVASDLAGIRMQVDAYAEKTQALAEQLERTEIRTPVDGQVMGLKVQSPGAVIRPGDEIMEIVPLEKNLLIEVKIAPHLIDRISPGLFADVRFSAFSHSPQLVVKGEVASVSQDLLTDPRLNPYQQGSSYYLALISLTPEAMERLGNRRLQPGMPVQAIIKTGERTVLTYMLHPLIKRMSASMKEE